MTFDPINMKKKEEDKEEEEEEWIGEGWEETEVAVVGEKAVVQLDLGYPATSYPDISIIRPWSCSVYCLFFVQFHTYLTQNKDDVVKFLFYFILYPFH